jgi:O-methyltransferase
MKRWLRYHLPWLQRLRGISMHHPTFSREYAREVESAYDAVRVAGIGLALETVRRSQIPGAIAELGVYRGETSRLLHQLAPERDLYLFDTFSGFPEKDDGRFQDTAEEVVFRSIGDRRGVSIKKGVFPATAIGLEAEIFAFVMLDADRYQVTMDGLEFFYPRLSPGGFIFVHDYNSPESDHAVSKAVDAFFSDKPEWPVELPDRAGSVVIRKGTQPARVAGPARTPSPPD